jgi:hypothetical protein
VTPWQRRKKRKSHPSRRAFNRPLAGERIAVKHSIESAKRLRVLRDDFLDRHRGMVDEVMVIGCALHNYRSDCRQPDAAYRLYYTPAGASRRRKIAASRGAKPKSFKFSDPLLTNVG